MENAAGEGYEQGKTWDELHAIFSSADPRIGLCIDTQHDFRKVEEVQKFFWICDTYFPGRLQCIHLNDSGVPFGSRVDSHGNTRLGEGYIWSTARGCPEALPQTGQSPVVWSTARGCPKPDKSLKYLLREGYKREIDFVLETGGGQRDLDLLHTQYYFL